MARSSRAPRSAATTTPALRLTRVADLTGTTAMASRPGTCTLYVTEQTGVVRSMRNGAVADAPVVDLSDRVSQDGGERGLLGLAFSPDGTKLYVDYTDTRRRHADRRVHDARDGTPTPRPGAPCSTVDQPQPNHNGGQLAFGPDGYLYIGLGDGGAQGDVGAGHQPGGNGQSLATLLGKILRIDPAPTRRRGVHGAGGQPVRRRRPTPGPRSGRTGLRNPWRFSFDRANGDLWIGDVGQNEWEEIDHAAATNGQGAGRGVNFGWNRLEGDHEYRGSPPADVVAPVYELSHDTGACAIVGGYVYRGTKDRALIGTYLFSDNCDSTIRLLVSDGNGGVTMEDSGLESASVSSFGQANGGALYVLSLSDGVFRVDPA